MRKLLIVGAGGHGKVCLDIAVKMSQWDEIAFIDDNPEMNSVMGVRVLSNTKSMSKYVNEYQDAFVAIGNNEIRERITAVVINMGYEIINLIHPNVIIGIDVKVGNGCVFMAGAIINSGSRIANGVIVNTAATVDHDCEIGNFVHLSPGVHISGTVRICSYTWVCIGASVTNNILLECKDREMIIVGAGAVVLDDIFEAGIYVGIPAVKID